MAKRVKVGVVGCGGICKATYMGNIINQFAVTEVVGCYDLIEDRMDYMVNKYGIKKYKSLEDICSDPEIQVIVNLTYPESHVLVTKTALEHGKHVYCEKMMAPTFEEAKMLHDLAEQKGLVFTTAPDTILGAWEQSARKYLDDGIIGEARTVHAQITMHYGVETPFFDVEPKNFFFPLHYAGGFPFDFGGYYLHEIINLFGSVKRVTGFGGNLFPERKFENPKHPKYGEKFEVNTPTTLVAALEFENGVVGTFHLSSDSSLSRDFIVTGTQGTLELGDPNVFTDVIAVTRNGAKPYVEEVIPGMQPKNIVSDCTVEPDTQELAEPIESARVELPLLHGFSQSLRGVGLADMCYAMINGRKARCHNDIGLHAIEVIHGIQESCKSGKIYEMTTKCERPAPLKTSALSVSCQEAVLDD